MNFPDSTLESRCSTQERFDLILKGGTILDGTGSPGFRGDIGVLGDRIQAIGQLGDSGRIVDASGLHLAPGFVDVHAHTNLVRQSGSPEQAPPGSDPWISQGPTEALPFPNGSMPLRSW